MGGNFVPGVAEIRPGVFINFESQRIQNLGLSQRGVVVIPLINADWGPHQEFIEISNSAQDAQFAKLGHRIIDSEMLLLREAFKKCRSILAYRPSNGTKATGVISPLTVTAKYGGTRGNDLSVIISDNVSAGKDISVTLDGEEVFKQEGAVTVENLNDSDWVDWSGTGNLANTAGTNLTGGDNTAQINADITTFLDATETQTFQTICFPIADQTLQAALGSKIDYFRQDIGKKVIGVAPNYAANKIGIINVVNGVLLADGTAISALQATAWVAAATAAANVNESLTFVSYDGSVDANPRLTDTQIKAGIVAGQLLFIIDSNMAVVQTDINSLATLTSTQDSSYKKNRVIRVLDEFNNLASRALRPGRFDNNPDDQALAREALIDILEDLEELSALKNVNSDNDVVVDSAASIGDSIFISVALQPVDSIEKAYLTVRTS